MKKSWSTQKFYDLIFIENDGVSWFRISRTRGTIKVLKSEKVLAELYAQGVFKLTNLEPALSELIIKFKLREIGIVIHLPNLLFQRISLARDSMPREAILNYLKTSFPLPLDKYSFFYREDKYQKFGSLSNFNIFFVSREIIDGLLTIIEKYGIIPLFISPSVESYYQYLVSKAIVDFNEEYLAFFIDNFSLVAILIKNLRIEKIIIDEIESDKFDKNLLVRIYNFLKANFSSEGKILFFSDFTLDNLSDVSQQQIFFQTKVLNVLLEGGYFSFERVMNDDDLIDFLPIKPYSAYFLNRLPRAITFVSLYTFILLIIFGVIYYLTSNTFQKELVILQQKQVEPIQNIDLQLEKFQKLIQISQALNTTTLFNFNKLKNLVTVDSLEEFNLLSHNDLELVFKIDADKVTSTKELVSSILKEAKIINEEYSDNRLKLRYNFY
ncbi:MAG: hypothetical protein NZ822_02165 [Patescibacteria group bacterium]|nr:hypothetical protein [Patescibacteria group bacterium]